MEKYVVTAREGQFYVGKYTTDEEGTQHVTLIGEGDWLRSAVKAEVNRLNAEQQEAA